MKRVEERLSLFLNSCNVTKRTTNIAFINFTHSILLTQIKGPIFFPLYMYTSVFICSSNFKVVLTQNTKFKQRYGTTIVNLISSKDSRETKRVCKVGNNYFPNVNCWFLFEFSSRINYINWLWSLLLIITYVLLSIFWFTYVRKLYMNHSFLHSKTLNCYIYKVRLTFINYIKLFCSKVNQKVIFNLKWI